jgi:hypothetical protein
VVVSNYWDLLMRFKCIARMSHKILMKRFKFHIAQNILEIFPIILSTPSLLDFHISTISRSRLFLVYWKIPLALFKTSHWDFNLKWEMNWSKEGGEEEEDISQLWHCLVNYAKSSISPISAFSLSALAKAG